jgi:hypothetical protein
MIPPASKLSERATMDEVVLLMVQSVDLPSNIGPQRAKAKKKNRQPYPILQTVQIWL